MAKEIAARRRIRHMQPWQADVIDEFTTAILARIAELKARTETGK